MRRLTLRAAVALVTFTVGSSATALMNFVGRPLTSDAPAPAVRHEAGAPAPFTANTSNPREVQEVLGLLREYAEAQTRHDASFFEENETDSYTVTFTDGSIMTKAQVIADMKTWDVNTKYAHEDLSVQFFGDAAVVTGWMTATSVNEGERYERRWKSLYLLTKRGGRWKVQGVTQVR